jgi:putative ABC transport system ATP-binding protein
MIEIRDVTKRYVMGDVIVEALRGVTLTIADGEFVAIMGPSGSGKSTLMNVVGCLDIPSTGSYKLDGVEVSGMSDDELAAIRNKKIGFVFQSFNLLPRVQAIKQVELPLMYAGVRDRRDRAIEALESVGLGERIHHTPRELSGGQQQRVAIARAIVGQPSLILADEPTGALDTHSTTEVMELFTRLNKELGITVAFVTHEPEVAAYTDRTITIRDGQIVRDGPSLKHAPGAVTADQVGAAPHAPEPQPVAVAAAQPAAAK